MKKKFGEYFLGLDIGTDSVGWAVTDSDYRVPKLNGRALWGIRLFDKANTSADMRTYRSARRRIARRARRIGLLQELFADEISKVDPGFFLRLKESGLHENDKSENNRIKYSLFTRDFMTDREYYDKYPTVYHLRKALSDGVPEAFDVRLLYMAVAHILKHRGHFLFPNLKVDEIEKFEPVYADLEQVVRENVPGLEDWSCADIGQFKDAIRGRVSSVSDRRRLLESLFASDGERKKTAALAGLLSGGTANLANLFGDETLKETEVKSFSFKDDDEKNEGKLRELLGERFEVIAKIKAVYDWGRLRDILGEEKSLSAAKVKVYDEHRHDLELLKKYCRGLRDGRFKDIFGAEKEDNYSHYIGSCLLAKGKKAALDKKCGQEDFCKFLAKTLRGTPDFDTATPESAAGDPLKNLFVRIKLGAAFPKQVGKSNGAVPMQVNGEELRKILANAAGFLPFLRAKDATGLSVAEKIEKIFEFRIPYYVGPLAGTQVSLAKKRCWVVRKSADKIYPWNFKDVIDERGSAEKFITNMNNKCAYLEGEDVLPKNSLLYSEFMARNELNNLTYKGEKLSVGIIGRLYDDLLPSLKGKLTKKKIAAYLRANAIIPGADEKYIGGADDVLQANLQSYKDFAGLFGRKFVLERRDIIEDIIRYITLFGGEKTMLKEVIVNRCRREDCPESVGERIAEKMDDVCGLRYKDWGRLSRTLLESGEITYLNEETGEETCLIAAMRAVNKNLMQLLHTEHTRRAIEDFNGNRGGGEVTCETVDGMYLSPAVKRGTWQTVLIVREIKKIMGRDPRRIFIEMARDPDGANRKTRTQSRKDRLLSLYKACADEAPALYRALEGETDERLRGNKLYLYYTQLGRDMYTGKPIDIASLYAKNRNGDDIYDRDHIFPRSKTKDDSMDNLVLVNYLDNRLKTDVYPLSPEIQSRMKGFWTSLLQKNLISQAKYNRLTRATPLSDEELAGFISRQLVETRQSTKAAVELLKLECPESEIVYSKAGNVSDFRQRFDMLKCRDINDYHHARDAYLNIVVGNAFHVRFTASPLRFIRGKEPYTLDPRTFYGRDIRRGNEIAWRAGEDGTLRTVGETMARNDILYTHMEVERKGQLFDLNPLKKGKGQVPLKAGRDIAAYGGYNNAVIAYFMLVRSAAAKGRTKKTLEAVPVYLAKRLEKDPAALRNFLTSAEERGGCGLKDPEVLIEKIRLNSLMKIDGCMLRVTGKTGNRLTASLAAQCELGYGWEKYFRKVAGFLERDKGARVGERDAITAEENVALYDALTAKHGCAAYRARPSGQAETLRKGKAAFEALSVEEQCAVLAQIMNLFKCKPLRADLRLIGGTQNAGVITFGKGIDAKKQAVLYRRSVTGVFQKRRDLLKL